MSPDSRDKRKSPQSNQFIDARPGDQPASGPGPNANVKSIEDTKVWKSTKRGVGRLVTNYINTLKTSWFQMPRFAQEDLITKASLILTIGISALALLFVYSFLNMQIRILVIPMIVVSAWFLAMRVVAPIMIERFSPYMNGD